MKWHLRIKRQMSRALTVSRHDSTAPSVPKFARKIPWLRDQFKFWGKHLNFYRLHMLFFFFVCVSSFSPLLLRGRVLDRDVHTSLTHFGGENRPLIASGIMYGSNGENHISYPDCLFSASCVAVCSCSPELTSSSTVVTSAMACW